MLTALKNTISITKNTVKKISLLVLFLALSYYSIGGDKRNQQSRSELAKLTKISLIKKQTQLQDSLSILKEKIKTLSIHSINPSDSTEINKLISKVNSLSQLVEQSQTTDDAYEQSDKLSIAILAFGVVLILSILLFQSRSDRGLTYLTFKIVGVIFIGTVSVYLITAGFNNSQITPVVGLLGTLAGYLIGSSGSKNATSPQSGENK